MEKNENIILKGIGGFYYVKTPDGIIVECKAKGKFRNMSISPLAGDIVDIDCEQNTNVITAIHPRKNQFLRPPFANLDLLILVVSTVEPVPNYLVLDKLCAIARHKNAEVSIVITKTDLKGFDEVRQIYQKAGFPVFVTSFEDDSELCKLKALMHGKLCAFAGNSGVGKSTLLNRLFLELSQETNAISQKLGRGKHTTREVEIFEMADCMVADTPGFSSIELDRDNFISKSDLQHAFIEFEPFISKCKFRDCGHTTEIGCAVKKAVAEKNISSSRYDSYIALYDRQKNIKDWEIK